MATLLTPVQKIRKQNFKLLIQKYGSNVAAGHALSMSEQQVSNYSTAAKGMGEKLAARIEEAAKLKTGSLSSPDFEAHLHATNNAGSMARQKVIASITAVQSSPGYFRLQTYDDWIGDNQGISLMSVPVDWLKEQNLDPNSLKTIKMPDESQRGLVGMGFDVAVNIGAKDTIVNDLHYAIKIGGVITIRRFEIQYNDDIIMRCTNPDFTDQRVISNDVESLEIIGVAVRFQGSFPKIS